MDGASVVESDTTANNIFEDFVKDLRGSLHQNVESVKKAKKNPAKRKKKEDNIKEEQKLNLTKKTIRTLVATEQQEIPAYTAALIRTDW